jgi:putative tRNA adenosine deaminase-associated protein
VSYFAAALTRTPQGWQGQELDLDGLEDLEAVTDALRDLDEGGLALLLLEQDDEWLGVVRVEGDEEPRVFLSDRRAVHASDVAALLWDEEEAEVPDEDEEEGARPVAEPVGDASLLADLGTPEEALLGLCAEEGMLPADVLTAVGERAGFVDVLDGLREA